MTEKITAPIARNPGTDAVPVVPHDVTNIVLCRALMIGTAGALKVITSSGDTRTFPSIPIGLFPLQVSRVFSTGTTADNIVAIY